MVWGARHIDKRGYQGNLVCAAEMLVNRLEWLQLF